MTACMLHTNQKAHSYLSRLRKKQHEHAVAMRRVSKNLQQGISGGKSTENRRDNTSHKNSEDTVQLRSSGLLRTSFLEQATGLGRNQ